MLMYADVRGRMRTYADVCSFSVDTTSLEFATSAINLSRLWPLQKLDAVCQRALALNNTTAALERQGNRGGQGLDALKAEATPLEAGFVRDFSLFVVFFVFCGFKWAASFLFLNIRDFFRFLCELVPFQWGKEFVIVAQVKTWVYGLQIQRVLCCLCVCVQVRVRVSFFWGWGILTV
jgi:hypothetical protein